MSALRPGWVEQEPYRGTDGEYSSYRLRFTDDHWVMVHSGPEIRVIKGPLGIDISRKGKYVTVVEAMRDAEKLYRQSLTNSADAAERRAADARRALAEFDVATQPVPSGGEQ